MKIQLMLVTSALAFANLSAPTFAQMHMPGMAMPMPSKKEVRNKPAAKKKQSSKKLHKAVHKRAAAASAAAHVHRSTSSELPMSKRDRRMVMPRAAEAHAGSASAMPMAIGKSQMPPGTMPMPMPMPAEPQSAPAQGMPMPMPMPVGPRTAPSGGTAMPMGERAMGQMPMVHAAGGMSTSGALGEYPEQRESSGTAWQPDASAKMSGPMLMSDGWMLMVHGTVNLVYDHQSGPRGDDKIFSSGMLMGMARHPLGNGTVEFRAMLSPDPIMGPTGYPLLLATGETANGRTPLVDRQHPHDLFMELAASVSQDIGSRSSLFLYAGLPGEPAFGPPAFMHREAILDSPEAPITHHWLDSTHISYGVVTAGLVLDRFKIEASRFNAREPDQHRWNIETGPLDSTAIRLSWNPTRTLALQGSWGHFRDPEQLEPGSDQTRWSASALWADDLAGGWHAAATLAWGRKSSRGHKDDAVAAEASIRRAGWTVFGRGEWIENRELLGLGDSPAYKVGKVSLGGVRDFPVGHHLTVGPGVLFSWNFVPQALSPLYGSQHPTGMMAFVRLKLD